MEEFPNFELLERYRKGELSEQEEKSLKQRRTEDEAFNDEVRRHLSAQAAIRQAGREHLKQRFREVYHQEETAPTPKVVPFYKRQQVWLLAAAVITLLVATWLTISGPSTTEGGDVFATYYELPATPLDRGGNDAEGVSRQFDQALDRYDAKEYAEAISLFETLLQDSAFSMQSAARFYQGHALLQINKPQKALEAFEEIIHPLFIQQAQWFSALAYLKLGQTEEAKNILEKISGDEDHYQQEQAGELLEELAG